MKTAVLTCEENYFLSQTVSAYTHFLLLDTCQCWTLCTPGLATRTAKLAMGLKHCAVTLFGILVVMVLMLSGVVGVTFAGAHGSLVYGMYRWNCLEVQEEVLAKKRRDTIVPLMLQMPCCVKSCLSAIHMQSIVYVTKYAECWLTQWISRISVIPILCCYCNFHLIETILPQRCESMRWCSHKWALQMIFLGTL